MRPLRARNAVSGAFVATALAALAITGCSDDAAPAEGAADSAAAGTAAVEIVDFTFAPREVRVPAGTTVVWTNRDAAAHTVEDRSQLRAPESEELREGDEFSLTYDEAGTYPYVCGIHNYMTGTVVVERAEGP